MTTKREQIMQAIATRLAAIPGVTGVHRSREDAMSREESPAVAIRWTGEEVARDMLMGVTDKDLAVEVWVYARGNPADTAADPAAEAAHALLMGEPTLGGLAQDINEAGTTLDLEEADLTAAAITMRFRVTYRHARTSLAA